MKKKMMATVLAFVMVFGLFGAAALQANEIGVSIDGVAVDFEGQPPALVDGRTMVPVRGVFEALGFDVSWEQATLTATLTRDDFEVVISIGSEVFTTNGEEFLLDVPAQIIEGRTLLPIRAVLESVGYEVSWDGDTSTVVVDSPVVEEEELEEEEPTFVTIAGTQYNTALTTLDLADMNLGNADIMPLQQMVNLKQLYLNDNAISNLAPLAKLINLEELHLSDNQISDLSPLAGLTKLEFLDLDGNQISSLSPLSGLTNLSTLWLDSNQISNISPLSGLTNLRELWLEDNQISSISTLSNLTKLEELYLSDNQIRNLTPLGNLSNLTTLRLARNRIVDISPLSRLTNLEYLDMGFVFDTDSLLKELGYTRDELARMGISMSDLSSLIGNVGLNHITDWSPVDHVPTVLGRPN